MRKLFYPENYFKILAKDTLQVLYVLYGEMKESRDCVISFISQLLGKICIQGYTDTYMGILLPRFIQLTQDDFIWQRLCCNIITRVPEIYLDCLMEYLLQNLPWYGTVSKLIGDSVLTNQKLTYIMTQKCLLLRHYQKELILHNIIGYLAHSTSRHGLFIETLKMLFDVWSDSSALKHTSYEQHLYITKAILIALGHVNEGKMKTYKEVFMTKMMNGMQCHLDSPLMKIRRLGMIVAESLTQIIDSNSSPLKFEYQSDDESDHLISLLKPPEDPGIEDVTNNFSHCNLEEEDSACKAGVEQPTISDKMINMDDELDSDDDIEPYDMSADTKDSNTKQPMYIRDCMQGLVTQDDPERVQACLTVAEKLVRANPDNLSEICVEFVKLLLHTQDSYGMNNFTHLRHSAMVAITVHCPIQVAVYLTEEFFSRNYNIRQRMDILEVLASASQELSQPDKVLQSEAKTSIESWTSQYKDAPTNLVKNWREIVQERIESKTRRFSQKSHKQKATPVPNRFAPVAGYFFFPLLKKYDMSMSTLNLLNQDYLLLGRLIYTLGVIMHAAINTTCCHQMASSLLEFLWVVRYHSEAFVRQAILFSLSMVVLTIPSYSLVTTLQSDVIEFKQWLQDIIEKDPDTECKKLAIQT
ncbi:telomere length regulation protein TEL2 homolog isoform X2 [Ptychodera flava]|uniref:telomere length regulation protein TEL2 homolog isoform X2 n=1 Tax=Ptychodera flava TaxID=63121 RepID=UPI00396A8934